MFSILDVAISGNVSPEFRLTRPAPTVLPPSRMANRIVFSIAIGVPNSTSTETLSPGMTISTPSGSFTLPGHVGCAEIKLRTVIGEERRVTAAFLLAQDVNFRLELLVRLDRARLGDDLAALDVFLLRAAQQHADVVAGARFVEKLAEHFDVGGRRLRGRRDADDLDFLHLLEDAALDTTGRNGAATFNVEHVFHRHEERLIDRPLRHGDVIIDRLDERENLLLLFGIAVQRLERAAFDDRNLVAREIRTG